MSAVTSSPQSKLFQPMRVGEITVGHRVVMAPLTRLRATKSHIPTDLMVEHYSQRASVPGTLLITEATFITPKAGGLYNIPGIWNEEQILAWKKVTDAVHARGSFIFLQLWALGRRANIVDLENDGVFDYYVSSSPVRLPDRDRTPRALTIPEIKEYVQLYATAASNAVHGAGFDGVEVHGAGGYLPDQFLQEICNQRTDEYGGSLENRCRFSVEVIKAISDAVGEGRTAYRMSPWGYFGGVREKDPKATFGHLLLRFRERHPRLAYIHLVEPRTDGPSNRSDVPENETNDFVHEIWGPRPIISSGGYTVQMAMDMADKRDNYLIGFGRYFIANPDLPLRMMKGIPWTPYNRPTFYTPESPVGYTDYPFAKL